MDENALAVTGTENRNLHFTALRRRPWTHSPTPGSCRSLRLRAEHRPARVSSRSANGGIERANVASAVPSCRYSSQCSSRKLRRAPLARGPRRILPKGRPRLLRPAPAGRDRPSAHETRRSRPRAQRLPTAPTNSKPLCARYSPEAGAAMPPVLESLVPWSRAILAQGLQHRSGCSTNRLPVTLRPALARTSMADGTSEPRRHQALPVERPASGLAPGCRARTAEQGSQKSPYLTNCSIMLSERSRDDSQFSRSISMTARAPGPVALGLAAS